MKLVIDISEQDYVYIAKKHCLPSCDDSTLRRLYYEMISNGIPLEKHDRELIRNIVYVDLLDAIQADVEQNAYPIVHGVNNHELGMTLYGILQVIDKYRKGDEE